MKPANSFHPWMYAIAAAPDTPPEPTDGRLGQRRCFKIVPWLVLLLLGGCEPGYLAGKKELGDVDATLQGLEQQLPSNPAACLDYLDLCERAASLCVMIPSSTDTAAVCAGIKSRCDTNLAKYCSGVSLDAGTGLAPDAGSTCKPATCAAAGKNCGSIPDGCGGTLDCGTCTAPQTCGGGGTPNVCGSPSTSSPPFAWWKLDETSGTTAADSAGSNSGTLTNMDPGTAWGAGHPGTGGGLSFDGTDDHVVVGAAAALEFGTGDFSLAAWFYLPSLPSANVCLINKGAFGSAGYGLSIDPSNRLCADIQGSGGSNQHVCYGQPSAGAWHHAVAVFDRSDKVYLYLDGALAGSQTFASGNTNSVANSARPLTLGRFSSWSNYYFHGTLDDVRVYDRALTAAEASDLYHWTSGGCTPTTCAAQGKNCGSISDGCGGTLNCGTCTAPATCGGGGTPNVCGGGGATCGNGVVETGEVCDSGSSNGTTKCGCQTNCKYAATSVVCRASTGNCDPAEYCNGSGACPADTNQQSCSLTANGCCPGGCTSSTDSDCTSGGTGSLPQGNSGIAAKHPGDVGIASDPAVIFADDFEASTSLSQRWDVIYQSSNVTVTTTAANVYRGSKALQLRLPQSSGDLANEVGKTVSPERDVLFLRWYQKLAPSNAIVGSSHQGGYLAAHYFVNGQATPGVPADGYNKFLVGMENWRGDSSTPSPGDLNVYVYYPEQRTQWGDHFFPTGTVLPNSSTPFDFGFDFIKRPDFIPQLDKWYCYELMVKANTPGQRDGRIAMWVDGVLKADFGNLRLRDTTALKMDRFGIQLHAGSNPAETYKWVDNVVVASSYIGPIAP